MTAYNSNAILGHGYTVMSFEDEFVVVKRNGFTLRKYPHNLAIAVIPDTDLELDEGI